MERARELQESLATQVIADGPVFQGRYVVGCDVAYGGEGHWLIAGAVVWDMEKGRVIESHTIEGEVKFPYVPGYLSFRECPPLLEALSKVRSEVHAVLADGHGIAHPKGFGLASHLGLHLEIPTIGCAKNLLAGDYQEPGNQRGDLAWIFLEGKTVGAVLRTRSMVRPIFVSPGNRIGVKESVKLVLECCKGYRIPEPIRSAHILVQKEKKTREAEKATRVKNGEKEAEDELG